MMLRTTLLVTFIATLLGCQSEAHRAEGNWRGTLVNQGVTLDLGVLTIGADYIAIPALDERYEQLQFENQRNNVLFGRKSSANFQTDDRVSGATTQGSIKLIDKHRGLLTFNRIQGTIRLNR